MTLEGQFRKLLVVARRQTRKGTELPLPCLCKAELPTLHPVSDVITVHLVHLMHPVGSCLGVCLSRTAKSLHSIFHIAERFCLPTGTIRSAVICIYLCSNSKQRIALIDYDKSAYFSAIIAQPRTRTHFVIRIAEIKFQNHYSSIISYFQLLKMF